MSPFSENAGRHPQKQKHCLIFERIRPKKTLIAFFIVFKVQKLYLQISFFISTLELSLSTGHSVAFDHLNPSQNL